MVLLTALIVLEKTSPQGERVALAAALAFAGLAGALLLEPSLISDIT
jgi:uncharacterized membrane protein YhhN